MAIPSDAEAFPGGLADADGEADLARDELEQAGVSFGHGTGRGRLKETQRADGLGQLRD